MTSTPRRDAPTTPIRPLLLLFVLSGAAGLIYEVVWARQLVLVFGNTSQAVSTILTGFFGGLAIGGVVGGRVADRVARPLRLYGALELVVVVVVLLTPVTFHLVGEAYRGVYPSLSGSPQALALVRFILSILALAPATILMGATLPTLTRHLTGGTRGLAAAFQRLYTANTAGAIVGTLLAGFVLIELLGLSGALRIGAACSATAGLVALLLDRRSRDGAGAVAAQSPTRGSRQAADARPADPARKRLALGLAFVSGLTSLGYQVTWNRLIGAGTGSSTYVFTIILALFLMGIALGAGLLGALRPRVRSAVSLIAVAQIGTAVLVVLGAMLLASPPSPLFGGSGAFAAALGQFAGAATFIVLPPTILMGITFPATAAIYGDAAGSEGSATGFLLAVNTVGSLVATFVLPFLVIPLIGSPATLACLAIVNALVGALLLVRSGARLHVAGSLAGVAAAALVVVVATAGLGFRNPTVRWIQANGGTVYAASEDEIASVVAGTFEGSPQLWVAGTSMTLLTVDTKLMPVLPVMLRPQASRGLVIAFGMGTAFRTALNEGIRTDVVELVPSVPSMFQWFYPDAAQVLANPNGHVIIADGRNHVELTSETYDCIVVDPPPPIETSGVSVISSLEFYQAAKARLNPGGVMVQWVPYGQSQDEFLAHVRTFLQVFPNVRVIAGAGGYGFYLIGSDGSVDLDPATMASVLQRPGLLADVNGAPDSRDRTVQQWVATLQGLTWASGDALRRAVGDGPLVTDDRPLPEYFLIRRLTDPSAKPMTLDGLRALLH
jgi:spermidine synthase